MRRRLYPMPITGLLDSPEAMTLPAAAFGMLVRLSLHFYASECRPLSKSDDELRAIARAHRPTWVRWKSSIMRVFEAIKPELDSYHRLRESKATTLSRLGQKTSSKRKVQALATCTARPSSMSEADLVIWPQRESRPEVSANFVRHHVMTTAPKSPSGRGRLFTDR